MFQCLVRVLQYCSRFQRPSGPLKYRTYAPDRICGRTDRQTDSVSQSRFNIVGLLFLVLVRYVSDLPDVIPVGSAELKRTMRGLCAEAMRFVRARRNDGGIILAVLYPCVFFYGCGGCAVYFVFSTFLLFQIL